VLIVEDDKVVADGMNRYLRQAGYGTELAESVVLFSNASNARETEK